VDECYDRARAIIREHEDVLHACAKLLLEKEKIGRQEFEALFGDQVYPKSEDVQIGEGVKVEGV
jgi:cell division protease FtsH